MVNLAEVPSLADIEWFVPYDYQPYFIRDMWDNYHSHTDIPDVSWLARDCELIVELAGMHYAGEEAYFYEEAERLYDDDENAIVEHIDQVRDYYGEEASEVIGVILHFYRACHTAYGELFHPSIKEVW